MVQNRVKYHLTNCLDKGGPARQDTAMASILDAWFTPLTPLAFLDRSAQIYPEKTAIVYGDRRINYTEFAAAATRLAHALRASGVKPGDRVAYLLPNIPEMLIAHFGVPLAGCVLVAMNIRLAAAEIRHVCAHCGAKVLVVDSALYPTIAPVVSELDVEVVTATDPSTRATADSSIGGLSYQDLLARGSDDPLPWRTKDERATISINYTSGTTGRPKGVMYHHRGAYLNSVAMTADLKLDKDSSYLWTLPMFHCNGWTFTWGMAAVGARSICIPKIDPAEVWDLFGRGE